MSELSKLEPGQTAPSFSLLNHDGQEFSLSSLAGKKVILYFYPAASTPACSKEALEFNADLDVFHAAGYEVVGVSPDEPKKLATFKRNQSLNFELLSDPEREVHKSYGAYGEKSLYGRVYEGVLRSTFVIDESGKITLALYNVKATGHVAMLRRLIGV